MRNSEQLQTYSIQGVYKSAQSLVINRNYDHISYSFQDTDAQS